MFFRVSIFFASFCVRSISSNISFKLVKYFDISKSYLPLALSFSILVKSRLIFFTLSFNT